LFSYQKRLLFPVYIEYPDKELAHLLQKHYAGEDSEFVQFTQLMSQHLHINTPHIRDLLGMIAAEELGHLELIGAAIKKLGGQAPLVKNYFPRQSLEIASAVDISSIMKDNEKAEEKAIKLYTKHIAKTNDTHIKRLLQFLINREEVHQKIFNRSALLIDQEAGSEQFSTLIHDYKMSLRVIT